MFVQGKGFVYTQPLYDTIHLAAAATVGNFFTVPFGGAIGAGTKNFSHTNLIQAGRLETGNEMKVNAISFHFQQNVTAGAVPTVADMKAINSGNLRWLVGGSTEILKIPVALVPSGGADFVFVSNIAAAATEFYLSKGVAVTQNKFYLDEPYVIKANESIEVVLENMGTIAAATRCTLVLWGTAIRPLR